MSPFSRYGYGLPKAVKALLIANAVVFGMGVVFPALVPVYLFGLVPAYVNHHFMVWQFVTYMFLHGGFGHIFWNMFGLWMFGSELEYTWGTRDFLLFYFICGIGGGVLVWLTALPMIGLSPYLIPTIGASGAIFGLLVAYGLMWPDRMIYLFGVLPMRSIQFVIIYALIQVFQGFTGTAGGVAVFAHLGGGMTGFLYLKGGWRIQVYLDHFVNHSKRRRFTVIRGGRGEPREHDPDAEVDRVLDKIAREGMASLNDRERRILNRASKRENENR